MKERHLFGCPLESYEPRLRCENGLPVLEYVKDFAHAMVEKLYPELEDARTRARKCFAVQSLMDSPPVRSAFWRFTISIKARKIYLTEVRLRWAIYDAYMRFGELMSTGDATSNNEEIHRYLEAGPGDDGKCEVWNLVLRFLICVEIWREYGTRHRPDWSFGSKERNGEFLTAMFLNFCNMHQERCFKTDYFMSNQRWDHLWSEWLENYLLRPVPEEGVETLVTRQEIDGDEETVLREVGYLGGRGTYIPVWIPPERRCAETLE